jgi:hypothetical protein
MGLQVPSHGCFGKGSSHGKPFILVILVLALLEAVTLSGCAGLATSTVGQLTVSASTLDFNNVNVGSSTVRDVTFANSGNSNITILNVSVSGPGFNANGGFARLVLTPGQTATLNLTFTPAASGGATGSVTVASNASDLPALISLLGVGVQQDTHPVTLTWDAPAPAVSGYNVYRATVSGGPYMKLTASLNATTTFADTTVQPGETYYYVATAVDSSGVESSYSNEVSATIPGT